MPYLQRELKRVASVRQDLQGTTLLARSRRHGSQGVQEEPHGSHDPPRSPHHAQHLRSPERHGQVVSCCRLQGHQARKAVRCRQGSCASFSRQASRYAWCACAASAASRSSGARPVRHPRIELVRLDARPTITGPNGGTFLAGSPAKIAWRTSLAASNGYFRVSLKKLGRRLGDVCGSVPMSRKARSYSVPWTVSSRPRQVRSVGPLLFLERSRPLGRRVRRSRDHRGHSCADADADADAHGHPDDRPRRPRPRRP